MSTFFQPRYVMALIIAFSIDAFQFLIGAAIVATFSNPVSAFAVLGCAVSQTWIVKGCWLGAIVGGVAGGVLTFLTGGALEGMVAAMGDGMAAAVDLSISAWGGAIVICMLVWWGIVPPGKLFSLRRSPFLMFKIIPGLDALPFFTAMVIVSIMESETRHAAGAKGTVLRVATAGASGSAAGVAVGSMRPPPSQENPRPVQATAPMPIVDGIRTPRRGALGPQHLRPAQTLSEPLWPAAPEPAPQPPPNIVPLPAARTLRNIRQGNTDSLALMRRAAA